MAQCSTTDSGGTWTACRTPSWPDSPPPADQSFSAIDRLDTLIKGGGTLDRKDRTAGTLERKEKRVNGEAHGASAVDVNLKGNKRHYMY